MKKTDNEVSRGIAVGVLQAARGYVHRHLGEQALVRSSYWFGNGQNRNEKKAQNYVLLSACTNTWYYGAQMCKIIHQLYSLVDPLP
jgi:hypothetical protein